MRSALMKSICYPESYKFTTDAIKWGCQHENHAKEVYFMEAKMKHMNLTVTESGLIVNPQYPHLGASPDGIISCDCCGSGVLEVKCPFSCLDKSFVDTCNDTTFCLGYTDNSFFLRKKHAYYYQVQAQMALCEADTTATLLCGRKMILLSCV